MKRLLPLLALLLFLPALAPSVGAEEDDRSFIEKALAAVRLGEGIQANQVTIFPLVMDAVPENLAIVPNTKTGRLTIKEAELSRKRYALEVMNGEADPLLLLGGTVLSGGERDRLIPRDYLLPPGQTIEIESMPAAASSDRRSEPVDFETSDVLAPPFLQEEAMFGASHRLVPAFITDYLEFRNEGDERRSLVALNESSKLTQYCLVCHRTLASFPQPKEPQEMVVGGVSAVRGRIQSLVIFGDNALLRAWFEPMLKGHSFAAAAIEIQADRKGVPIPGKGDPEKTLEVVKEGAEKLLGRLANARLKKDKLEEDELGDAYLLSALGRVRGRALGYQGHLVHLVAFPHDPFERALFKSRLDVPDEDILSDPERMGLEQIDREQRQGRRLTEAEQRLLDRLRPRRSGANPGLPSGPDVVPGPRNR